VPPPRPSGAIAGPAPSREREDLDIHSVILKGAGAPNFPSLEKIASANNLYKPDAEAFFWRWFGLSRPIEALRLDRCLK